MSPTQDFGSAGPANMPTTWTSCAAMQPMFLLSLVLRQWACAYHQYDCLQMSITVNNLDIFYKQRWGFHYPRPFISAANPQKGAFWDFCP